MYDTKRRSKYFVKTLNVRRKFESLSSLRSALWHELEESIPDEGDFNIGYFEGRQHTKKWLTSKVDLDAMYTYFNGKMCVNLWCDGKEEDASDDEVVPASSSKKSVRERKKVQADDELEEIFLQLKDKHRSNYSGPQLRLWARMIIAKTHDSVEKPPNVPMITGLNSRQRTDSFSDAMSNAATAFAKALSPVQSSSVPSSTVSSPSKTVSVRMQNLEQLRALKQLQEDGVLTEEEYLAQKEIVIAALARLT